MASPHVPTCVQMQRSRERDGEDEMFPVKNKKMFHSLKMLSKVCDEDTESYGHDHNNHLGFSAGYYHDPIDGDGNKVYEYTTDDPSMDGDDDDDDDDNTGIAPAA
ncbi:hypothetical protein E3N88_43544 [Mikania micrantha]|uniref:Uncharacterized protein n=1 Tax=Mikania micrantha TaxID=192012 RepID=A0A5N6LEM9_9ASTR|nr:hypothetical protein E3N88_43544 [Mikania micrantha]